MKIPKIGAPEISWAAAALTETGGTSSWSSARGSALRLAAQDLCRRKRRRAAAGTDGCASGAWRAGAASESDLPRKAWLQLLVVVQLLTLELKHGFLISLRL